MRSSLISHSGPLYNEEEFVRRCSSACGGARPEGLKREVIVVDDASTDGSGEIVAELAAHSSGTIRLLRHARNQGKGAAIRTALEHARGEITIIQDADLEYDPREYPKLLGPLLEGKADVVYGLAFNIGTGASSIFGLHRHFTNNRAVQHGRRPQHHAWRKG